MALARVFLAAVERVETHPVNQGARLMKFLLAAEEVDSQWILALLDLSSYSIHWIFENSKSIDGPIEIHDLAPHSDEHSS